MINLVWLVALLVLSWIVAIALVTHVWGWVIIGVVLFVVWQADRLQVHTLAERRAQRLARLRANLK